MKHMPTALPGPFILLLLWSCTMPHQEHPAKPFKPVSDEASSLPKGWMVQAYSSAIAEYIKAVSMNDGSAPDTLFVGKHVEFPDIELPTIVQQTSIRLLTPDEADRVKDSEGFVFLNMFAWFRVDTAEFIVVTFKHGFRPQHNCMMELVYNTEREEFDLDSLSFEYPYPKSER